MTTTESFRIESLNEFFAAGLNARPLFYLIETGIGETSCSVTRIEVPRSFDWVAEKIPYRPSSMICTPSLAEYLANAGESKNNDSRPFFSSSLHGFTIYKEPAARCFEIYNMIRDAIGLLPEKPEKIQPQSPHHPRF